MNKVQRNILMLYLLLTLIILVLDNLYPAQPFIRCFKFAVIVSLFLAALRIKGKNKQQIILSFALFFTVVGDFFLNFCQVIPSLAAKVISFGLVGFTLAYLLLIAAFFRKLELGKRELFLLFCVSGSLMLTFLWLYPYFDRSLFPYLIIFGIVLGTMSWNLMILAFRASCNNQFLRYPALSGLLILISDLGVANALFNPAFNNSFVPWLENIIWATFIPAWTIILILLTAGDLKTSFTIADSLERIT